MELVPALSFALPDLAAIFARAFEGYFVPLAPDAALVEYLVRCDGVSLAASRVALVGGTPIGLALVALRGASSRLAAMGIVPEQRASGYGRRILGEVLADARARGTGRMVLEVITRNEPAIALYRKLGFTPTRRLRGFTGTIAAEAAPLEPAPIEAAAALLPGDLPWSFSATSVRNLALPNAAYRLGPAVAVVAGSHFPTVRLRAIAVEPAARRTGAALRLLRALAAMRAGKPWEIGANVPEGPAEQLLLRAGLQHGAIDQWEMEWKA